MLKRFLQKIGNLPLIRNILAISHKITLPGFEGHSIYEVFAFFFRGIFKGQIQTRASAMAFSMFLAVFPTIIFLFTLIPYIPIAEFQDTMFEAIKGLLPNNMFLSLQDAIKEITHGKNTGLLSFGFIAALYFSKNGVVSMMDAFNASVHVRETRAVWKQQVIATALVVVLTVILLASLILMIGAEYAAGSIMEQQKFEMFWFNLGKWTIMLLLFLVIIGTFYRYGPAKRRHRVFLSPGVILAAILSITVSILFSWYVNNFGSYNSLYGSIGTIMVVMLWIYFNCTMLLIGFELDAGIYSAKAKKRSLLEQEAVEEAAEQVAEEQADQTVREA